jgi:HlyD family secretion protein
MAKRQSRKIITLGVATLIGAALTAALWPRPMMVDMGEVKRGRMTLTIDEEGRTRVHDAYVVSTPVAGRLLRVHVEPGDAVVAGESLVAEMLPANPPALDARSRAQARAEVTAAEAALRLAHAQHKSAVADQELADAELARAQRLRDVKTVSQSALDHALREARTTEAARHTAEATIAVRQAELVIARAQLIGVEDLRQTGFGADSGADSGVMRPIDIHAPTTGRVLRVIQESESTLPAGVAILEIGDVAGDLEVLIELLSSDAVQVEPGDRVLLTDWGGPRTLNGVVDRIEPWGFTKVSALGVEEQRVKTIARFSDPPEARARLGDGFRVEARILVWEDADALIAPSSALFRDGRDWVVFVVADGRARTRRVEIGRNNGVDAQVLSGLEPGETLVLYPSSALNEGARVKQRAVY